MRRRIEAEGGAIARLERLADVGRLPLPPSYQREAADHRAHLVVEEAARGGGHVDLLVGFRYLEPVERLDRAVRLALRRAEGREVMTSNQVRRTVAHRAGVERDCDVPHTAVVERGRRPAVEDAVQ